MIRPSKYEPSANATQRNPSAISLVAQVDKHCAATFVRRSPHMAHRGACHTLRNGAEAYSGGGDNVTLLVEKQKAKDVKRNEHDGADGNVVQFQSNDVRRELDKAKDRVLVREQLQPSVWRHLEELE
eukprot:m.526794 g.526794  ORF g.526794 m.526794 type:complete len:127 (+) comp22005_c1_seq3:270-650(+)